MVLLSGKKLSVLCDPWITFDAKSNTNLIIFQKQNIQKNK